MEQQILTALLVLGVPYITDILKRAYALIDASPSPTITHLKPIVAGIVLSYLSNKTGLPIPADLVHLTNDYNINSVATGALFGAAGHWLSGLSNGLKTSIPSTSAIGKGIAVVLGKY
jgi:hypothetical protein